MALLWKPGGVGAGPEGSLLAGPHEELSWHSICTLLHTPPAQGRLAHWSS